MANHPATQEHPNGHSDPVALETVNEAMAHLAVGRTKLYALIAAGEIEIVKPSPRMTRVIKSSRRAYVERLRTKHT